jgi:hypothetical protein
MKKLLVAMEFLLIAAGFNPAAFAGSNKLNGTYVFQAAGIIGGLDEITALGSLTFAANQDVTGVLAFSTGTAGSTCSIMVTGSRSGDALSISFDQINLIFAVQVQRGKQQARLMLTSFSLLSSATCPFFNAVSQLTLAGDLAKQ